MLFIKLVEGLVGHMPSLYVRVGSRGTIVWKSWSWMVVYFGFSPTCGSFLCWAMAQTRRQSNSSFELTLCRWGILFQVCQTRSRLILQLSQHNCSLLTGKVGQQVGSPQRNYHAWICTTLTSGNNFRSQIKIKSNQRYSVGSRWQQNLILATET